MRVSKAGRIVICVVIASLLFVIALVVWFAWPFVYDISASRIQQRALRNRSDHPQIAAACVALAKAVTNDSLIWPTNPIVPKLLRSLSPRYIGASSNRVTMEFHGGFDHYGYHVWQSDTNAKVWEIFYYTEKSQELLTTISSE